MNPFSLITSPINNLWDAIAAPFRAVLVVGLCYFINQFTSPWSQWWHWVAFGMTISVIVAWARAFKTIALLIAVYYVGKWVYGKYGDAGKAKFDQWVNGKAPASAAAPQPRQAKDVLRLIGSDSAVQQAGIVA